MTDYVVYDVFTDTAFGGNPLAVIPDARALAEEQLQRIAREFNYSESTFVYPPETPGADARVRIFTPMQEIPFAGHPIIGTATALAELGRVGDEMILDLGIGQIPVAIRDGRAQFVTREPLKVYEGPSVDLIAAAIGAEPAQVRIDRHAPVIASVGLPFAIAEVVDRDALAAAVANSDTFHAFKPNWPGSTHLDLLIYVRNGDRINARMFAPLDGIPEDPATGSAAAALAAFLGHLDGVSTELTISQGVEMGRPSQITASVTVENDAPTSVAISGRAIKVMEGRLTF